MALTDQQIEKLRPTVMSQGWQDVVKPIIQNSGRAAMDAMLLMPERREGEFKGASDDYLRGQVAVYGRMLAFFERELEFFEQNRLMDEVRKKQEGQPVGSPYGNDNGGGEPAA